jgi:hypothetical protein
VHQPPASQSRRNYVSCLHPDLLFLGRLLVVHMEVSLSSLNVAISPLRFLSPTAHALQHLQQTLTAASARRAYPDCLSDTFSGFQSAFVFATATQQTIGGPLVGCSQQGLRLSEPIHPISLPPFQTHLCAHAHKRTGPEQVARTGLRLSVPAVQGVGWRGFGGVAQCCCGQQVSPLPLVPHDGQHM